MREFRISEKEKKYNESEGAAGSDRRAALEQPANFQKHLVDLDGGEALEGSCVPKSTWRDTGGGKMCVRAAGK